MDEEENKAPVHLRPYLFKKGEVTPAPSGPRGPKSLLQRVFSEHIEDEETAELLWQEYFRLCLHARSEELRSKMLADMLDRMGLPRVQAERGATAIAQVVNIIRNSPDLGV